MPEDVLARLIESGQLQKGEFMVETISDEPPAEVVAWRKELFKLRREAHTHYTALDELNKRMRYLNKSIDNYYQKDD